MKNKKNVIEKISTILIFLILILYYGHNYLEIFIIGQSIKIYQIGILLLTVTIMIKILIIKKIPLNNIKHCYWFFTFLLYTIISLIWSINSKYSIAAISKLIFDLIMIFDLTMYIRTKKDFEKVIIMHIIAYLYMCIRLIFFEKGKPGTMYYGNIVGLYFNIIALSLGFGILFCIYLFKEKKKYYWLLAIPVFYYIIYLTGSRKGILMPIMFFLAIVILNTEKSIKKILINLTVLCIMGAVCIGIIVSNPSLNRRIDDLFDSFLGKKVEDFSINERKYFRDTAKQVFLENPIIGIGVNGFAAYMLKIGYSHVAYAHNNWVELLSTLGILGFIIYYSQYYYILKKSLKIFDSKDIETIIPLVAIVVLFIFEYGFVSYYTFDIQIPLFLIYMFTYFNLEKCKEKSETIKLDIKY